MIEHQAARYLADIAKAIDAVQTGKTSYGEFYVTEVRFGFEGEETAFRVVPDDADGYAITDE